MRSNVALAVTASPDRRAAAPERHSAAGSCGPLPAMLIGFAMSRLGGELEPGVNAKDGHGSRMTARSAGRIDRFTGTSEMRSTARAAATASPPHFAEHGARKAQKIRRLGGALVSGASDETPTMKIRIVESQPISPPSLPGAPRRNSAGLRAVFRKVANGNRGDRPKAQGSTTSAGPPRPIAKEAHRLKRLAGGLGLEPRMTVPKSAVYSLEAEA